MKTTKVAVAETTGADPTEAAHRFEHTMRRVLSVSKDELTRREAAYKKARRSKKTRATRAR